MLTQNVSSCDVLFNRKLGLALFNEPFGAGTGAILLDDVNCRGNETSLSNCPHRTWGEHDCNHNEDVSIICVDELSITGTALRCTVLPISKGHVIKISNYSRVKGLSGRSLLVLFKSVTDPISHLIVILVVAVVVEAQYKYLLLQI